MGGGLMQLVAYGAQDIYLTGNPQITFFKVVYRRHTNFSMESIKQMFDGTTGFGKEVSATISRNGDLVYRMYLEHSAKFERTVGHSQKNINLVERYGDSLIKECEIEIGGQKIDKHTSMWNRVYSDLTEFNPSGFFSRTHPDDGETNTLYNLMTGNTNGYNTELYNDGSNHMGAPGGGPRTTNDFTYTTGSGTHRASIIVNRIFLPLNFWFNRNPGLALPLIALQYHEVKVKMIFEDSTNLSRFTGSGSGTFVDALPITTTDTTVSDTIFNLWCDYIYLDTDERRRFAQVSHEYLIEQLQYSQSTISTQNPSIKLRFNHPVKELIWTMRNETAGTGNNLGGRHQTPVADKGDSSSGPVSIDEMGGEWKLKLNGHDRFKERDTKYFTRTQVWEHHTGYGGVPVLAGCDVNSNTAAFTTAFFIGGDSIGVYSFALKPEEHQPSGTCNFSRIDNAELSGQGLQVFTKHTAGATASLKELSDTNAANTKLTIFAVNYNVLRIMSGMGGLAYSN